MSATSPARHDQDAALFPLPRRDKAVLTMAVVSATLMQVLDSTIANVALPHMQASLGATQDSITWVLTSYIIASAVAIPVTGWLADQVGSRRLFLLANLLFVIASMLCGIATSLPEMVAFRLLQGIAGAFIVPLTQTALLDINPRSKHPQTLAIYGMSVMIGPVVGPILGGWLTDNFTWRWVFFINLPIGLASMAGLWLLLPQRPIVRRPFDLLGFSYLALALGALQLMLDRGSHVGWFDANEIWMEAGIAAAFLWMFAVHMATAKRPLFHMEMLRDRNLLTGILFLCIIGLIMMSGLSLMPPMLQHIYGFPAMETGEIMASRGFGVFAGMLFASRVVHLVDSRIFVAAGFLLVAVSLGQMMHWPLEISAQEIIVSGLLQGLGMGIAFIPLNYITFSTLKVEYRTDASAVINLSRSLGASIGISMVTALLARNIQVSHSDLAGHITQFRLPVDPNMALSMGTAGDAVMSMIDAEINRQAALIAYIDDFYLMMWLSIAAIPLALLLRRPTKALAKDDVQMVMD